MKSFKDPNNKFAEVIERAQGHTAVKGESHFQVIKLSFMTGALHILAISSCPHRSEHIPRVSF